MKRLLCTICLLCCCIVSGCIGFATALSGPYIIPGLTAQTAVAREAYDSRRYQPFDSIRYQSHDNRSRQHLVVRWNESETVFEIVDMHKEELKDNIRRERK